MSETICYTAKEVKQILNVSQGQVYALFNGEIAGERFPSFKIGNALRVTKKDFEKWLENKAKRGL